MVCYSNIVQALIEQVRKNVFINISFKMGSGGSVPKKTKDSTNSSALDIAAVELINNEIKCLQNATQSKAALDAFTDASRSRKTDDDKLHSASTSKDLGIKHSGRTVTDSAEKVVQDVCSYLDQINDHLDDLRASLNTFSDAVLRRNILKYSGNDFEFTRHPTQSLDDQIVEAKERLQIMKKENKTSDTIESLKCQLDTLELMKADLQTQEQNLRYKRTRYENAVKTENKDDGSEDRFKWKEKALKLKQKYKSTKDDNKNIKLDYDKQVNTLQESNGNLTKQLKALEYDQQVNESKVEYSKERVQKVEEKLLEERLSHEVEINALRAIIEKRDETIAMLRYQLKSSNDSTNLQSKDRQSYGMSAVNLNNKNPSCIKTIQENPMDGMRKLSSSISGKVDVAHYTEEDYETTRKERVDLSLLTENRDNSKSNDSLRSERETKNDKVIINEDFEINDGVIITHTKSNQSVINENMNDINDKKSNSSISKFKNQITNTVLHEGFVSPNIEESSLRDDNTNQHMFAETAYGSKDIFQSKTEVAEYDDHDIGHATDERSHSYRSNVTVNDSTKNTIDKFENISEDNENVRDSSASPKLITDAVSVRSDSETHRPDISKKTDSRPIVNTENKTLMNDIELHEEGTVKEIVYKRNDGEVDGNLAYHKGIGAVVRTTSAEFGSDSVRCDVIDEVENEMLPDFVEGERAISFHLHIQKKYGAELSLKKDESVKLFIPHRQIEDYEEAVLIYSVNGDDWEQCDLVTDEMPVAVNMGIPMLGTRLQDVTDVKLVVIAREKTISLIAGENDVVHQSKVDSTVTVKINTEAFKTRTEVKLLVHHSHGQNMMSAVEIHNECRHIMSCTSYVSMLCEQISREDVSVTMELPSESSNECKYTLYNLEDSGWKLADCDWSEDEKLLTIHLLAGARKYRILGVEMPLNMSVEERLLAVKTLHDHISHYSVRLLFRQKNDDPQQAVVICLGSHLVKQGIYQLESMGYSIGGFPSAQFCLLDGDMLCLEFTGDITAKPINSIKMDLTFYLQREIATKQLLLQIANGTQFFPESKMIQGTLNIARMDDKTRTILAENVHLPVNFS